MKQVKEHKSHKNGLSKHGKKQINWWKFINTSNINFMYILNSGTKVNINYKDNP